MNTAENSGFAALLNAHNTLPVIIGEDTRFVDGTYLGSGFVDFGGKADGMLFGKEAENPDLVKGNKYRFMVLNVDGDDTDAEVTLSYVKAKAHAAVEAASTEGTPVRAISHRITRRRGDNKIMGLDVFVVGEDERPAVKAFVPLSEVCSERVSYDELCKRAYAATKQKTAAPALVLKSNNGRFVLSFAKAQRTERFSNLEIGSLHAAKVLSIQKYGAIVDIGGLTGLVYINEIPNRDLSALSVGQTTQVSVIGINTEKQQIDFSMTAPLKAERLVNLKAGMEVDGLVRNVAGPGAFITIDAEASLDGLVPPRCFPRQGAPRVGDKVRVRIVHVDLQRSRIALTMQGVSNAQLAQ